jgi:hypothetical protein
MAIWLNRKFEKSYSRLVQVWKILYYFITFSQISLFSFFSRRFSVSHKIVDIYVLTRIGLDLPVPSGSAQLFGINAGVLFGVELVLI